MEPVDANWVQAFVGLIDRVGIGVAMLIYFVWRDLKTMRRVESLLSTLEEYFRGQKQAG